MKVEAFLARCFQSSSCAPSCNLDLIGEGSEYLLKLRKRLMAAETLLWFSRCNGNIQTRLSLSRRTFEHIGILAWETRQ